MSELWWQVPVGVFFLWLCVRTWRWLLRHTPAPKQSSSTPFSDELLAASPGDAVVVVVQLRGGMADGESVEIPGERSADGVFVAEELCIHAMDNAAWPPQGHHLLYRASMEDPRVFLFAGTLPAAHEMMGDN